MKNYGTTNKKYEGVHLHLAAFLKNYDPEKPLEITVFCKGIIVSGILMTYDAYTADMSGYDDEDAPSQEMLEFREWSKRRSLQNKNDPFWEPKSFVIKDALVSGPKHFQKTPYWIGHLESVDGYELQLYEMVEQ